MQVHGLYNYFWRKPLRETLDLFDRAIQSAHDCGNNEFVSYVSLSWSKHAFYVSIELAQVEERCLRLRTFIDAIHYATQSRWVDIYVTAVQALRGSSSARGITWRGTPFDDDRDLPDLQRVEDQLGLLLAYSAKAWVATLFGDHDGVEEYSDLSCSFLVAAPAGLEKAIITFVCGLRRARELRENSDRLESEQALQEQLGLLERFARLAPMNFAHKHSLVQAEVHRARGEVLQAMQAYEQASQGARENGYLSEAGLAHALAAEFFQDLGLHQAALHNAEQAVQAWRSWGAHALVESLGRRLPDLLEPSDSSREISSEADSVHNAITRSTAPIQLDLEAVTSATELLSAETDPEQLCIQMMNLVMSNSGAETVVLLLKQGDEWFVQARGAIANDEHQVLMNQPFDPADGENNLVPESVFNYCVRTEEVLVVSDARLDDRFTTDRVIQRQQVQSLACVTASRQAEVRAMLYVENRQVAGAFTQEHASVLRHLATQFVISLQNALLYEDLNRSIQRLKDSDERYELAVAGSDAGLFDWDIVSDTLYCSDRLKELLGYAPDEISLTMDAFWDWLHPDDVSPVRLALERHLEERAPYVMEYRLQTKSGEYRWYHARGQALWDEAGAAVRMSGSMDDIDRRKRAEAELRESEERFRSLMEQSPLPISLFTPDGKLARVNPAWTQSWGVDESETARLMAEYDFLTDEQIAETGLLPLVQEAFAGDPVVLPEIEYSGIRSAEEMGLEDVEPATLWLQIHLYPIKNEQGAVEQVVAINVDTTELRRAERDAREQRDALARVDRTARLSQLRGSIAHELNQPLTGILSNAQAAELMLESNRWKRDELARVMSEIAADAKRAGNVIHGLRELFREHKEEYSLVDVNAVVAETTHLLHSEMVLQQVELTTECAASLPRVNGNSVQIQQVLFNLITNGVQAMESVPRGERLVGVATALRGNEVVVWVDDRGPGIDPDKIDRIFEPLATWKPGGTGMGLALSNAIIVAHGGRMWAQNKPDGGARVGFAIPVPH